MTAPTTAAQLAAADDIRTAQAVALANAPRYVDRDVEMLLDRYSAEVGVLTERGAMATVVRTGGNFFAIEGTGGLSPDNRVMFVLATNAVDGGLEFDPANSSGWVVGLYDCETNELIVSGDDADIEKAFRGAYAVLRGEK
ncbi:hypothetical protein GS982_20510 [Rhodococcus hoagii]|nr:hypothetical protein [Prescottella equi]NKZ84578.1 hypothetical protein [Prescottella equi]